MRRWLLGFPVDTPLDVSTWFEEVTRLTHRDLPEFVPITSTVTEELTEHTQMRVNQRVYSMILMSPCRPSFTCLSSFTEIIPVAWRRCVWS